MPKHVVVYLYPAGAGPEVRAEKKRFNDYDELNNYMNENPELNYDVAFDKHDPKDMVWVNVYLVDRCYGGPEEGGWWYDDYQLVDSFNVQYSETEKFVSSLENGDYSNEGKRELHSVLSDGRYCILVEDERGESETTERPHYC